uniref:W2 domain-containing protein n=1 Tax=Auxenochlorella protothecoides TaxID=3075 RepID=A0A1D2A8X2_AUXPR
MASINIGGENAGDAFYRYKMPKLKARIEGRGNGIKTNVENNVDIAKALERPPEYTLKFFGCELGAQTKFEKASGTSIVNGAHDASRLSELLESFIKKYVQCYSCGNPETVVKIKRENIFLKCKACGFVSEVDARLKLNTFILKNPPDNKLSKAEKKVKKLEKERMKGLEVAEPEKEDKKKKKKKSSKSKKEEADASANGDGPEDEAGSGDGDDEDEDEDEDEVVWMTDTSEAAMARRAAEQLSGATAAMVTQGNLEAEMAAAKKAEEAAKKAAEEEAAAAAAAQAEADAAAAKKAEEDARLAEEAAAKLALASPEVAAMSTLRQLLASGTAPAELAATLRSLELPGGPAARASALYQVLFGDVEAGAKLSAEVEGRKAYLAPFSKDAAGQLGQLVAVEKLVGVTLPARVREAPLVIKALYDLDLVEEDLILAWYKRADAASVLEVPASAASAVRAASRPFVEWLEQAESSEEDSDEE